MSENNRFVEKYRDFSIYKNVYYSWNNDKERVDKKVDYVAINRGLEKRSVNKMFIYAFILIVALCSTFIIQSMIISGIIVGLAASSFFIGVPVLLFYGYFEFPRFGARTLKGVKKRIDFYHDYTQEV